MPAEVINSYCFCFWGEKKMTAVKLFYIEASSFSFFLLSVIQQLFCGFFFICWFVFFGHNLNLFLLYLWHCQQFPDRYSVLSFLSSDPIVRLQNLHYKDISACCWISNIDYLFVSHSGGAMTNVILTYMGLEATPCSECM